MRNEEKVACRTPAEGRDGVTNIPKWKYDAVSAAILLILKKDGAVPFKDLHEKVRGRLDADTLERLGSLKWHVTTVKLEMEVRGDIVRLDGKGPQRIALRD
ncbi:MAG: hypothetical protein AAGJ73_06620 [Pseudomonadota bacterium]